MTTASAATAPVTSRVAQPPSKNLMAVTVTRMKLHKMSPRPFKARPFLRCGSPFSAFSQWRTMPSCESTKVMNTLME